MRLNPSCIRAILLAVENKTDFKTPFVYDKESPKSDYLAEFSHEEILYHIKQAHDAGFFDGITYYNAGNLIYIGDLSFKGHEFLANIRNDTFYNKVKDIGAELGVQSLKDLTQIALSAASLLIKSHFNLP